MLHKKAIGTIGYMAGIMSLPEPFTWSLLNLFQFSHEALCQEGEFIHPVRAKMSLHDIARNEIVAQMCGDWLLMLDTDMVFDPDLCARLVRTMYKYDLDVVTGIYSYKRPPHLPVLYMYNQERQSHEVIGEWNKDLELFEVQSSGAGCLLIRRRVFEQIKQKLDTNPFDRIGPLGEDHSFYTRLRELGIKSYCAWKVQAGHLTYRPIETSADYVNVPQVLNTYAVNGFPAQPETRGDSRLV